MAEADDLFYNLRVTYVQQDAALFADICNTFKDKIFLYFKLWQTVPEPVRDDQRQLNIWAGTLFRIAEHFDDAGMPELFDELQGDKETNPLIQLQNMYMEAQQLYNQGKFDESNAILLPMLPQLQTMKGMEVSRLMAMVCGQAGSNYLRMSATGQSKKMIQQALDLCREVGDMEGVSVYEQNLMLVESYEACQRSSNDPLISVRNEIVRAQKLSDKGNYTWSNTVLNDVAETILNTSHPLVKKYDAKVCGLMGLNYFRLNNYKLAKELTRKALMMAETNADRAGVVIYKANLATIEAHPAEGPGG